MKIRLAARMSAARRLAQIVTRCFAVMSMLILLFAPLFAGLRGVASSNHRAFAL